MACACNHSYTCNVNRKIWKMKSFSKSLWRAIKLYSEKMTSFVLVITGLNLIMSCPFGGFVLAAILAVGIFSTSPNKEEFVRMQAINHYEMVDLRTGVIYAPV